MCGACTLLIDGAPARSCITYAIACEGAEITTIEGLDDDEVTGELRAAFSREHGLQCGYCTPGMLVSARDIVTRLPDADERRVRLELSGNLCRCTGYVGIVRAVCAVLDERRRTGVTPELARQRPLGPVGSGHALPIGPGELAGLTTVAPSSGVTFTNAVDRPDKRRCHSSHETRDCAAPVLHRRSSPGAGLRLLRAARRGGRMHAGRSADRGAA